ncbi:GNAT family N-acetyltransferase [Cellulomonas sp. APG4]|uniref:GNAT family N-acetyltransferase n=1 Tax=Cellulomonas sp. APG4 TaxID=1538656 RepID=UPI0013796939|nr:GNAT family N-acetyltransferase [Cellulomonas sp. APG4]NCT92124.1 GNAT family N-acetyltransferase [Cellulomonas sp. APG4]
MLPDGLTLRTTRPGDLEQVAALLVDRGEEGDDVDHRLVVEDPAAGWGTSAVVVDGDRVVATATLLDETVRVGDVVLPAGQVELVATHEDHEGRGLMRALMEWAHELSATRGHLLQVMIGIPYVYRRFGYEYAIDMPPAREVVDLPEPLGPGEPGPYRLRPAEADDVDALAGLQDLAQQPYDVAVAHPRARWDWLRGTPASALWVLVRRGAAEQDGEHEEVVASVRLRSDDGAVLLADPAARDDDAADALLRAVVGLRPGEQLRVVHRELTVTGRRWAARLGPASEYPEQYYVRVPALGPVLDALRPVLTRRLSEAGLDRTGTEILVSTFAEHVRIPVADDGALGTPQVGGRLQWPASLGGAGVAPDQLGALLLGCGMHALARRRPDVYPGPDPELYDTLFPPVRGDVLSFYLPWD